MKNRSINVQGTDAAINARHAQDYISLTDMVKRFDGGGALIEQWLKNQGTVLFLNVWNLTVKKIPKQVLSRCKWVHDDYSLRVENLPQAPLPSPLPLAGEGTHAKGRGVNVAQGGLFDEVKK